MKAVRYLGERLWRKGQAVLAQRIRRCQYPEAIRLTHPELFHLAWLLASEFADMIVILDVVLVSTG